MLEHIQFAEGGEPIYRQLAAAIAERIARGELVAGNRLPPQRDIARMLGINLTTVTRAFATLQQRGLVESRSGRGSIIVTRAADPDFKSAPTEEPGLVDLSVNRPPTQAYLTALAALLPGLAKDRRYPALQDFHAPEGPAWAREAAATWLSSVAGGGDPSRVVLTNGAQHGLACVLGCVARPKDVILADAVTYQGISSLCRSLELDLRAVAMDRGGMVPDLLDRACAQLRPRAVFLVPNFHNPTATTLSVERRHALLDIARRHNVLIIEDDVYGPLLDDRPPAFASLEPDLTVHVSGLSKCVAPGLRLGFVVAPRALIGNIAAMLRINCWSIGPLGALIGARMIEDGTIQRIVEEQKQELRVRQVLLRECLGSFHFRTGETSTHAWLELPEPWRGNVFVRLAHQNGVGLLAGDAFAIGRDTIPHAVRINVGAARSHADLKRALVTLADLLANGHRHVDTSI